MLCLILIIAHLIGQPLTPIDQESTVRFSIKNFGVTTTGIFTGLTGTIDWEGDQPTHVNLSVDARTIDTGVGLRDNHLRKEKYFDVEHHPRIQFTATHLAREGDQWIATGSMTIKGVTREIKIPFTFQRAGNKVVFSGKFRLNRRDFDVGEGSISLADELVVDFRITTAIK